MWHFHFPDKKPDILHLSQKELLHSDWFLNLLDYEITCQKEGNRTPVNSIKILDEMAKSSNSEALNMLTDIGLKVGSLVACWAGNSHYERPKYKKALECYLVGKISTNSEKCINGVKALLPIQRKHSIIM